MPVIVFAQPKGGVGKSTSALILGTELAHGGASVSIIDADPNEVLVEWSKLREPPNGMKVFGNITEDGILDHIDDESARAQFVIVDLEGTKNLKISRAISRADLVVIPIGASHVDALRAADAIRLIRTEERSYRHKIPHAVIFTRTSPAIRTRAQVAVLEELNEAGVEIFDAALHDRAAFRELFAYGGGIRDLPEDRVRNLPAAVENAESFAAEVVERLRTIRNQSQAGG